MSYIVDTSILSTESKPDITESINTEIDSREIEEDSSNEDVGHLNQSDDINEEVTEIKPVEEAPKPVKKKRQASEKQKEALKKARAKAKEAKQRKKEEQERMKARLEELEKREKERTEAGLKRTTTQRKIQDEDSEEEPYVSPEQHQERKKQIQNLFSFTQKPTQTPSRRIEPPKEQTPWEKAGMSKSDYRIHLAMYKKFGR